VAVLSPGTLSKVVGAVIQLDGRGSYDPDGSDLTYTWSFEETPLGSTTDTFLETETDGSVVTFVPDIVGRYIVGLKVSTPYRTSEMVLATVDLTPINTPFLLRTTPDGDIMFRLISSFWQMVEEKAAFSALWSGYMQIAAAELLRLFQVDYAKSIRNIQPMFQRRWIAYEPTLKLDPALHTGVFGHHQSGSSAFTAAGAASVVGIIISDQEILLRDGSPSLDAVGTELTIYSSGGDPGNIGDYTINRINNDTTGYIVSASTPFPSPEEEVLTTGTDLVTFQLEDEVYVADTGVDFSALEVQKGDILKISQGYFKITGVGTADGLLNERTLKLESSPSKTGSGNSYIIFKALRILARRSAKPTTNTVFIPEDEADLSLFSSSEFSGTGTVQGTLEIRVESRHIFPSLVGQAITITSGDDAGTTYTIASLNEAQNGYYVSTEFSTTEFPQTVTYTIPLVSDISSRLLILDGRAYEITAAYLDETGISVEDGGFGPVWVITLKETAAPSSREGMGWRIPAVIESSEHEDLEAEGVSAGDLLVLDVRREDNSTIGRLKCLVLGAAGTKIAFDLGLSSLDAGENGAIPNSELLELSEALRVASVVVDEFDEGELVIALMAAEIESYLQSREFQSSIYNLPLNPSSSVSVGPFTVRFRVRHIIRNCRIPVDPSLSSVPVLIEYIDEPVVGEDEDGQIIHVAKDGTQTVLDREPLELIENRDFTVAADENLTGTNLETTADSGLLTIPGGDLIDRDVRVGDFIDIKSGFDQRRYIILSVVDSETIDAISEDREVPGTTATGLSYTLVRRTPGNFVRFVSGMFTAALPAPERLWAQVSLYDNSELIEDNFGVMVGVTREQLDEYGSSQISYKGAVTGLMYAWTSGPTVRNVSIGSHILVGLPVTEVAGQIVQIDDTYDTENGVGRVLIEDHDPQGNSTGLVRIYYYNTADDDTLNEFAGLATNPLTGATYDILDIVSAFAPLSKGVVVADYLTEPKWWATNSTGASELRKYHTWQVRLDAAQVDSRDIPLIHDFVFGIRPIYTEPEVVLVLYLTDDITIEDELGLEGDLLLADDIGQSIEATRMTDSYNGSSLTHRLFDHPSLNTRTFFEGRDLVTTEGSSTVTSVRGGFTTDGTLSGINEWFEDDVEVRGPAIVRVGDILFIREGVNRGRYRVTAVTDDNTLEIEQLTGWPPRSIPTDQIAALTGQVFQLQRQDTEDLVSVSDVTVVSYDAATDTTQITSPTANFRWNGCAVNDTLVVEDGADYGLHEVLQVGYIDGFGDLQSLDTILTIDGELTEAGSFSITVRRDRLRTNPLVSRTDGITTAASSSVALPSGALLLGLQYGDLLTPQTGADAGKVFKVIDVPDDTTIFTDQDFSATEVSVEFEVTRPSLFDDSGTSDSDEELTPFAPEDKVTFTVLEPLTQLLALTDLTLTGNTAESQATVLQGTVSAGDKLTVPFTSENSGVFEVTDVSGNIATVEHSWHTDEGPFSASGIFHTLAADWEVHGIIVTLVGATAAAMTGAGLTLFDFAKPGDVLEVDGVGTLVIAEVTSNFVLTFTKQSGVNPATNYTGRLKREA